jgi:hypothetical protein
MTNKEQLRSLGETSHTMPSCVCLACGKILNAASMVNGNDRPSPGSITICAFGCGHIMAFADDLSMRELTDKEIIGIAGDPRIVQLQNILGKVRTTAAKEQRQNRPSESPPETSESP